MTSTSNVFFSDDVCALLTGGSVLVPNVVLLSPKLKAGEKILYALILDYAQNQPALLTESSLQEDLGCDQQQVRVWLRGLKDKRLIRVNQLDSGRPSYEILPLPDHLFVEGGRGRA